jgi:uncharacterized membrane protein
MAKTGLRILGRPAHPMVIHFPMALLTVMPLWDLAALWQGDDKWWQWSFFNLLLGLVSAVPAATSGLIDYLALPAESPAQKTATRHMLLMFSAVAVFAIGLVVRGGMVPSGSFLRVGTFLIDGFGMIVLGLGGFFGGELAYGFGVGQKQRID